MVLNAPADKPGFSRAIRRAVMLGTAAVLIALGLYPAPLILIRDPVWRSREVVSQLADERVFWVVGLVVIIGPVILFAHIVRDQFDDIWDALRARLDVITPRSFMVGTAIAASILAAAAAVYVFSRSPTTSDEVSQLWQARILLSGRLALPTDPNPEFFAIDNIVDYGRWYSQFPIGWPLVLAIGTVLRATWLLNPLLAGLTVINVYRFAARVYGTDEARLAAVLCATCPYLLLMSGSFMNHTIVAFLATLALAELPAWADGTERRRSKASVVIGLSLGAAVAVRPLDGAVAALVFGGFLLQQSVALRRVKALVLTVAAGALPIAGLLVVNQLTTGHPLRFGYDVIWGANHSLGFHTDPLGNLYTPRRALETTIAYLTQLNWSLFGWPVAGVLVVAGALVAIRTLDRWEAVLIGWIAAQLLGYAAYFGVGMFLGPRYLFTVFPAFLLLAARGIVLAARRGSPVVRRSMVAGIAASLLAAWIPRPPFGILGAAQAARPVRASFKMDLDPALESLRDRSALIFVKEPASARLARRLWQLGISRPDAMRLLAQKDHCALLDVALEEERGAGRQGDHLTRLERAKNYSPLRGAVVVAPDPAFRISDERSITPSCNAEAIVDYMSGPSISYGQALLRNEIGPDGRIAGRVVFVADIGEHDEVLRARFGDRPWYRLYLPPGATHRAPQLIPYR